MIAVLADDFTGAAEIAGCASRMGSTVQICLSVDAIEKDGDWDFVIVDTDSRLCQSREAAQRVRIAVEALRNLEPESWFKKIDSVLRGNVIAEIEAMLEQLPSKTEATIAAANPSRGRRVKNGQLEIDGVPIHETSFRDDPFHPAKSSQITELLSEFPDNIQVPDVESHANLKQLADALKPEFIAAGASEFFSTIYPVPDCIPDNKKLTTAGKHLWIGGSQATRADRQARFRDAQIAVVEARIATEWIERGIAAWESRQAVAIECPDERLTNPDQLLSELVEASSSLISQCAPSMVFAEGGATAHALAGKMGWTSFQVIAELALGVVALVPVESPSMTLVVKPGSYLWPRPAFTRCRSGF